MRIEPVEIYSDASNAAVLRHPGRRFPGLLVQGDTLCSLVQSLEQAKLDAGVLNEDAAVELDSVIERLRELLEYYKVVLAQHDIKLPFYEPPTA